MIDYSLASTPLPSLRPRLERQQLAANPTSKLLSVSVAPRQVGLWEFQKFTGLRCKHHELASHARNNIMLRSCKLSSNDLRVGRHWQFLR